MTTTIQFYHLLHTPLNRALPKLMEKMLDSGSRAVVLTASESQAKQLSDALWNHDPDSFLAHGISGEASPELQPIYITWKAENPNEADILVVTDGSQIDDATGFTKLLDMFDGTDEAALGKARERWKSYKASGAPLKYYKQQPAGGWKEEAA